MLNPKKISNLIGAKYYNMSLRLYEATFLEKVFRPYSF
jgi:hypothetical protein